MHALQIKCNMKNYFRFYVGDCSKIIAAILILHITIIGDRCHKRYGSRFIR